MKGSTVTSDDAKYSHIAVSSDDEDDVVIHAGMRRDDDERAAVSRTDEERADGGSRSLSGDEVEDVLPDEAVTGEEASTGRGSHPADSFRETTEEDLAPTSMSTMQKAIIGIALLVVVGFVIYYSFLR